MSDLATLPQPDGRMNRLQPETYLGYSGGMNAFTKNHREVSADTLRHLVNGTVRGGWVQTRPNFEWIQISFNSEEDQTIFETGKVQGSHYYRFGNRTVIVYAIDGHLFAVDPFARSVQRINPEGEQPFSKYAHFVYFSTRSDSLISGDGIGRQVITEGLVSRYARPQSPHSEVPTGLMMADDWGRLAVVMPDRKRIKFSNHELDPDPLYTPFGFQEGNDYYLSAAYFEVPAHIGRIVWIGFLSQLNTDTGTGPLLVMGEKGIRYYDVSVDRTQWKIQDISGTLLPDIGGISHRAQVTRSDDLIFTDQHGRIRTLKQASQDQRTLSVKRFDRQVYPYYEKEPVDLRKWRVATEWNERVLVAIQPQSKWIPGTAGEDGSKSRFNIRHRGLAVWNGEISEYYDERDNATWDGLWTGIYPATLDTGLFSSDYTVNDEEMCIALSVDDDGKNRLYAIREDKEGRYDIAPGEDNEAICKEIEMQIVTRQFDFSARDTDYSLLLKRLDKGVIRVGAKYGQTSIKGFIQSDREHNEREWFEHKGNANHDLIFESDDCGNCSLMAGRAHQDPKLKLPSDQSPGYDTARCTDLTHFYKCAIRLVITGWARIEEMMFDSKKQTEQNTLNPECVLPEKRVSKGCSPNLWGYKLKEAE